MDRKEVEKRIMEIAKKLMPSNPFGEGRIVLMDRRYVMMSTDYFPYDFTKDLEELFNVAGDVIIFKAGEKVGHDLYNHYIDLARKHGIDIWDIISMVGWYFGWCTGYVDEHGENNGVYRIIVYDSFEAESFIERENKTSKPVCHFMRGVLHGIVEEVEGRKYRSMETKCKATGDDHCEFVFIPVK